MKKIWSITLLAIIFFISSSSVIRAFPSPEDSKEKENEEAPDEQEDDSEKGTLSPTELKKIEEKIIEKLEEDSEKFGLPLTPSPEEVEAFVKIEEEKYGKALPEKIEDNITDSGDDFKNFVHFLALFDKIERLRQIETSDTEEEEVKKSPEEMKEMKAEAFKLTNELNERQGLPEVSHEEFDKVWNKKEEEYGNKFPGKIEKLIGELKSIEEIEEKIEKEEKEEEEEKEEPSTPVEMISSETTTKASSEESDISKEESPKDAFILRNPKGNICILAKFHSTITITYPGKTSEQKVEVNIPPSASTKGKCGGPNRSHSLQISWGKFIFAISFDKTSEDSWAATSVELTYDKSEPLFDGAANSGTVTAKSKKMNFFETPIGKSYFCPGQETILLFTENEDIATVRLKEVHLQPYGIEGGKFSPTHRCDKVVIGGPDEEPFVQDETVPLAVGCTLALITLIILVGFSVYRAYHAAKVDYNSMG